MDRLRCKCGDAIEVARALNGRTQGRILRKSTKVAELPLPDYNGMRRREFSYTCDVCGDLVSFDSIGGPNTDGDVNA